MFWKSEPRPTLGPPTSEAMRAIRDEVAAERDLLAVERAALPTVAEFYAGRSVFVTGGSGFLGRLIIEQLLRTCPDIGSVYLVLRAKKGVAPADRIRKLTDVPLFDRLRAERPDALSKLVVLPGDTTELGLGLSAEHQQLLEQHVSVVFHVAASVRFDDPFRKAVFTNLRSTREVVALARRMPDLRALVHVSTAYCHADQPRLQERVYRQRHDWRQVIRWAEELPAHDLRAADFLGHKLMGSQANTYVFTKALAEELLEDAAAELPVVITRPSIVVPTITDPIPGWIDNLYGLGGFWAGGFKGLMRIVHSENVVFNSVPADVATKGVVLASWHKGVGRSFPRRDAEDDDDAADAGVAEVVNLVVFNDTGVSFEEMSWVCSEAGLVRTVPYPGAIRPPKFEHTPCKVWYLILAWYHHYLFGLVLDLLSMAAGLKPRVLAIYRTVVVAQDATQPFWRPFDFDHANQTFLQTVLHPADVESYSIMSMLSTRDDEPKFREASAACIRGILKYALKEEDNPEKNWAHIQRLKWVNAAYHTLMALLFGVLVYGLVQVRSALITYGSR